MENNKSLQVEEVLEYQAPTMEKHDPVKVVQGSGAYCYYYYNYYYGYYYYYC